MPPPARWRGRGKIVRGSPLPAPYGRLGDEDVALANGLLARRDGTAALSPQSGLRGGEQRGLAGLDDVLGAAHRTRGVEGQDLADDEPVEEHALRRQVLLAARG